MDALSPYFASGVLFAIFGFMVGRFQREYRFRIEARNNLAQSIGRTNPGPYSDGDLGTNPGPDSDRDTNGGTVQHSARREARRLAVRGDNVRSGAGVVPAGRNFRGTNAPPVGKRRLEIDCF